MFGNFKVYPYNDRYLVSDQGYVKDIETGVVTNGHYDKKGYKRVYVGKTRRLSNIVLETFVGPRPEGYQCDHKNAIRDDDRLDNLHWVTPNENNQNPNTNRNRWLSKGGPIYVFVVGNKIIKITETYQEMARYLGLTDTTCHRFIHTNKQTNGGQILKVYTTKK